MAVIRVLAPALMCAAIATPVSADVTLRLKGSGNVLGTEAQDTTEYRKGLKLRTDWTSNGVSMSSILDLSTRRMITLWHHSKTADLFEPKQTDELLSKEDAPPIGAITPTTQSRQILGSTCIVHRVTGSQSMGKLDMVPPTMVVGGTICLVKNGPGHAEFKAFYQASGKHQFLSDPDLGVPFAWEMTVGFKGDEPAATVMPVGTYG